jgi:diguanylate cyclase (GGDEF)-like protein/PAS domain S-box-containing protein
MNTAADGTIIELNTAFSRITGYCRGEVIGQNPRILSSGRQGQESYAAMWRALSETEKWSGEIWNRRKDGEVYAEMQTISHVRDANGNIEHYVAQFFNITAFKKNELKRIASFNVLTGLPNRVLFADRLQRSSTLVHRSGKRLAVVYVDLVDFKTINDKYKHEIGDQLLIRLAENIQSVLRKSDYLARLGSDEFVFVPEDLTDIETSEPMKNRLPSVIAMPLQVGEIELPLAASLGVTTYPQDEDVNPDQLLRHADQAMYRAKLAVKNRYYVFDAEHDRNLRGHHESQELIRQALTKNKFVLHYQPKVDMRTGVVVGVEALIRWQHPQRGLLPPGDFLPTIENHPLACEVGQWVIATALDQIVCWQMHGLTMPISVNVGACQLQQEDFVLRLRALLAAQPQAMPGMLELEVLETSALEDLAHISNVIAECRSIGINFALDDFGTGYSSLSYLRRLDVIQHKIDQSFVRDMTDQTDDLAILAAVIGLAGAFQLQVIAEGVETAEQGALLLKLGCKLGQGYFIARPMSADALPEWVAHWRPDPTWLQVT